MTFFVPLGLAYNSRCPKTCDTKLGGAVLNEDIQEKGIKLNHSCLFTDKVNYTYVGNLFFFQWKTVSTVCSLETLLYYCHYLFT